MVQVPVNYTVGRHVPKVDQGVYVGVSLPRGTSPDLRAEEILLDPEESQSRESKSYFFLGIRRVTFLKTYLHGILIPKDK